MARRLTAARVETVATPGPHSDGGNLVLMVSPKGGKRWLFRLQFNGKRRDKTLGTYPEMSLAEARAAANRLKEVARAGRNPFDEFAAPSEIPTFAEVTEMVLAKKAKEDWHPKHVSQWRSTLEQHAFPILGQMRVDQIEVAHVLRALEPRWIEITETMTRVRGRIEKVLAYASAMGWRTGSNPASWTGNLSEALPSPSRIKKGRHWPALSTHDATEWFALLRQRIGISARCLEFVCLTAARSGEARGARWSEIDLQTGVWRVPAERMKMKVAHEVPLSTAAQKLLRNLPRVEGEDLVFPSPTGKTLSDMALSQLMRRIDHGRLMAEERSGDTPRGFIDDQSGRPAVVHGLRATFRTWTMDMTVFPSELAERSLAHRVGSQTERAYARGSVLDQRRTLMDAWAKFLHGKQTERPGLWSTSYQAPDFVVLSGK